jgi:SAM-dependent methyltransferase
MVQAAPSIDKIEEKFRAAHPGFKTEPMDLRRIDFAAKLATGRSVADIGSGPGQLINLLGDRKRFARLSSVDIHDHSKRIVHPDVAYLRGDIRKRDFRLDPHDTIFCMEVMEHCEPGYNAQILTNLRRVALKRLVLTVPFNEPEPLWWHDKPGGHRQRFTLPRLASLFPKAHATFLSRYNLDWVLIVEDSNNPAPHFQIVDQPILLRISNS